MAHKSRGRGVSLKRPLHPPKSPPSSLTLFHVCCWPLAAIPTNGNPIATLNPWNGVSAGQLWHSVTVNRARTGSSDQWSYSATTPMCPKTSSAVRVTERTILCADTARRWAMAKNGRLSEGTYYHLIYFTALRKSKLKY